jgi:hypothetical protein
MIDSILDLKEVLLVLATGLISYFIAIHTSKSNTKNLNLQLQHNKSLKNNQIKIDKLEDTIVNIRTIHKELNILSLRLISILQTNTSLEIYRKEIKIENILSLQDTVQRMAVSLDIYAFHLSKKTIEFIQYADELITLIMPKNDNSMVLNIETIMQTKNKFHKSATILTTEITNYIRKDLI